jgi:hypothetical protein
MLQNGLRLVLLDGLRHHVQDIMHNSSTQLKVIVRLNTLFGHGLCNTLAVSAFELAGQQIAQPMRGILISKHFEITIGFNEPSLEKRNNSTHEEQPDTPAWSPEPTSGALANRACVEPVVD